MHIVNAMFSRGLGGIEQALVDYSEALKMEGHKVTVIISPKAMIKPSLLVLGVNIIEVKNFAAWDIFAKLYIKKIMKQIAPDAVIAHGNRAVSLIRGSKFSSPVPALIGVTHNYSVKHLIGLDAIFAITNDLKKRVISAGQKEAAVFKLPNMVRADFQSASPELIEAKKKIAAPSIICIGTMGRFVQKKGFDVFIRALAELQRTGTSFKAFIGGSGEEEDNLKKLAAGLGLFAESRQEEVGGVPVVVSQSQLSFLGWVNNKSQFFADIDIFILPSIHEPFGIILLEAFAHKKPVIVADAEGPSEIAVNEIDALVVPKGDSAAISAAIIRLIKNPELARQIAQNGFAKARTYDIKNFAASLNEALIVIKQNQKTS